MSVDNEIVIDADGRRASGHRFQGLADEYSAFIDRLHSQWTGKSPLPYSEFATPYLEARDALLKDCARLYALTRHAGDAQTAMATTNVATEDANVSAVVSIEALR